MSASNEIVENYLSNISDFDHNQYMIFILSIYRHPKLVLQALQNEKFRNILQKRFEQFNDNSERNSAFVFEKIFINIPEETLDQILEKMQSFIVDNLIFKIFVGPPEDSNDFTELSRFVNLIVSNKPYLQLSNWEKKIVNILINKDYEK